jgi:hypothetical protein
MPVIEQDNWTVTYERSASSGVRLRTCDYQSTRVLHAAAVPFVYVQYGGADIGPFTDELRSASDRVEVREIVNGFDICARYDLYGPDYQYDHIWRFHDDGQFGSAIIIYGPGEEIAGRHTYYVPFRFDIDISGASGDSMQTRRPTGEWVDLQVEGVSRPLVPWAPDYDWRVIDKDSGKSARLRARAGDNAQVWTLRYDELESWSSWGGAQKSPPGSPGSVPEIYQSGQSVQDTDLVIWYIAQITSVDRVAVCGPWFALEGFPAPVREPGHEHKHDHEDDHEHKHEDDHSHGEGGTEHEHDEKPVTKLVTEYLGRKIEIEPMAATERAGEHGGHTGHGGPAPFVVRIEGKEIIAHQFSDGVFHTHELPFMTFKSVEKLAETYVNHLEYGTYHGRKKEPEQTDKR